MGKKDDAPEGTPDWMVTYGDMMTLLMCFFVMLVAISNFDELKIQQAIGSFQFYLGNPDTLMTTQLDTPTTGNSLLEKVKTMLDKAKARNQASSGEAVHESILGRHVKVQSLDKGLLITIGGKFLFERNSYKIKSKEALKMLDRIGDMIRGYQNRIEVTGHCSPDPAELKGTDQWNLSFMRAKTVAMHFIKNPDKKERIPAIRFRLTGHGYGKPTADNFFEESGSRFDNRRVEILLANDVISTAPDEKEEIGIGETQ